MSEFDYSKYKETLSEREKERLTHISWQRNVNHDLAKELYSVDDDTVTKIEAFGWGAIKESHKDQDVITQLEIFNVSFILSLSDGTVRRILEEPALLNLELITKNKTLQSVV